MTAYRWCVLAGVLLFVAMIAVAIATENRKSDYTWLVASLGIAAFGIVILGAAYAPD